MSETLKETRQTWNQMKNNVVYPPVFSEFEVDEAIKTFNKELNTLGEEIIRFMNKEDLNDAQNEFCKNVIESLSSGIYPISRVLLRALQRKKRNFKKLKLDF